MPLCASADELGQQPVQPVEDLRSAAGQLVTVAGLVAAVGLRPLDAGPLAMARTLEHMGLLNVGLNARFGWPWRSGWKPLGPTG